MDPNATLELIDDALRGPEHWLTDIDDNVDSLAEWLAAGGVAPDWGRFPLATSYYNSRMATIRLHGR